MANFLKVEFIDLNTLYDGRFLFLSRCFEPSSSVTTAAPTFFSSA